MENPVYIGHPDQLIALARDWQEQQQQQQDIAKLSIRLSLLLPLANSEILASCRDPSSKHMRDQDGNRLNTPTNHEYLDLTALSKLWRKACMQIPSAGVKEICFDLALPRKSDAEDGQAEIIHWDAHIPSEGGIAVQTRECASLIVLLATTLKVREGGRGLGVQFRLSEGEEQGGRMSKVAKLKGTLERLSMYSVYSSGGVSERAV